MPDLHGVTIPGVGRPRRGIPRGLIEFALIAGAAVVALNVGRAPAGNTMLLVLAIATAPALLAMLSGRLELVVHLFLIYTAFEGLVKNVTAGHPAAYLLRDVFLIAMLVRLGLGREAAPEGARRLRIGHSVAVVTLPMSLFILITFVQFLNPTFDGPRTNLLVGLGGVHQRILPMVLFFAALRYMRTRHQVERLQRLLVYLSLIVGVVLLFQVAMGPERWQALGFSFYSQGAGSVFSPNAERAGVPRPASTAQDAGAAAWYMLAGLFVVVGLASRPGLPLGLVLRWAMAGAVLALALLLTYMRTAYMGLVLGIGLFLLLRGQRIGGRLPILVGSGLLVVSILGSVLPETYMEAIYYRAERSVLNPLASYTSEQGGRYTLLTEIPGIIERFPMGVGTGRTGPGQAVFSRMFQATFFLMENGFAAIILEAGPIAGAVVLWIFLAIIAQGLAILRGLRDDDLKSTAVALLAYIVATFAAMLSMNPLDASPFNIYLWLLSGVLLAIPGLDIAKEGDRKAGGGENRLRSPQAP